jgi:hypothetical protein
MATLALKAEVNFLLFFFIFTGLKLDKIST